MAANTYILVGLGNPGPKYTGTRHNIGFEIIDEVARKGGVALENGKWDAHCEKISLWGTTIYLIKPMTFMNLSGKAISRYVDFYKVPHDRLVIVHDDLDMKTGRVKLVSGGGTGGHNGIRSIIQCLGTKDFYRLKIGIGRPGNGMAHAEMPVDQYVLTGFYKEEQEIINDRVPLIIEGLQKFFAGSAAQSMNFLNSIK